MRNKATHTGTCQVCGSTQKLPSGRLALHGYRVVWNQFTNGCPGQRFAPLENSCERARELSVLWAKWAVEAAAKAAKMPGTDAKERNARYSAERNAEALAYSAKALGEIVAKWAPRPEALRPVVEVERERSEVKENRAAERAAKREAKLAKALLPDGSELWLKVSGIVARTLVTAKRELKHLDELIATGEARPGCYHHAKLADYRAERQVLADAIEAKLARG